MATFYTNYLYPFFNKVVVFCNNEIVMIDGEGKKRTYTLEQFDAKFLDCEYIKTSSIKS